MNPTLEIENEEEADTVAQIEPESIEVPKKIKSLFDRPLAVKAFVLDFEAAMWAALKRVFHGVTIRGCAFHWSQAVFRKVQAIGLQGEYHAKGPCHSFVRQILALPLLPAAHIRPAFQKLMERASHHVQPLVQYVQTTWMDGNWKPEEWSVFGQPIRTNNDCEGWHRRLNCRTTGPPPFYSLIICLHDEASLLPLQVQLMSERKLRKAQRKAAKSMQAAIFVIWERYTEGSLSTSKLLRKLSSVYAPTSS